MKTYLKLYTFITKLIILVTYISFFIISKNCGKERLKILDLTDLLDNDRKNLHLPIVHQTSDCLAICQNRVCLSRLHNFPLDG